MRDLEATKVGTPSTASPTDIGDTVERVPTRVPPWFRERVLRAAAFLQTHEQRLRRDKDAAFDAERIAQSLVFHALQGTLALTWDGSEVAGIAVAFQTTREWIYRRHAEGLDVFNWQPNDPSGDAVYLALVLTDRPNAMKSMAEYFLHRFPAWRALPMFAHRRNQLRQVDHLLEKLSQETVYG